jgi:hypothetical protein
MTDKTEAAVVLFPCPFCGASDLLREYDQHRWPIIRCDNCGACGPCTHSTEEQAEAAWQARAAPQVQQEPVEEVKQQALTALNLMQSIDMMPDGRHPRNVLRAFIQLAAPQVQQEPVAFIYANLTRDGTFIRKVDFEKAEAARRKALEEAIETLIFQGYIAPAIVVTALLKKEPTT